MFIIILLSTSLLSAMDRVSSTDIHNSPFYVSDQSSESNEDTLCDNVLNTFHAQRPIRFDQRVKPNLKRIIKDHTDKSSDEMAAIPYEVMSDMVQRAVHDSFEDLEDKNDQKWSKKKASMVTGVATILTAIIAIIVDSTTCKR